MSILIESINFGNLDEKLDSLSDFSDLSYVMRVYEAFLTGGIIPLDCKLPLLHNASMRVLTIRNVPNSIYDALTSLARENQRSLQQQTLLILEQTAKFLKNSQGNLDKVLLIRKSLEGRQLGDSLKELREDRDR